MEANTLKFQPVTRQAIEIPKALNLRQGALDFIKAVSRPGSQYTIKVLSDDGHFRPLSKASLNKSGNAVISATRFDAKDSDGHHVPLLNLYSEKAGITLVSDNNDDLKKTIVFNDSGDKLRINAEGNVVINNNLPIDAFGDVEPVTIDFRNSSKAVSLHQARDAA